MTLNQSIRRALAQPCHLNVNLLTHPKHAKSVYRPCLMELLASMSNTSPINIKTLAEANRKVVVG